MTNRIDPVDHALEDPARWGAILRYRRGWYGKIAAALIALSTLAYVTERPIGPSNGGTTLGYTLGTIALVLIIWLAWFGIRKRQYRPRGSLLEEWLSGHVYIGIAVLLIATLHTGFQYNWNIHIVSYALMVIVILSGLLGLYSYIRYPRRITDNRGGVGLAELTAELAAVDAQAIELSRGLGDKTAELVRKLTDALPPRPPLLAVLFIPAGSSEALVATNEAIQQLRNLVAEQGPRSANDVLALRHLLTRRAALIERCSRDYRFHMLMTAWRWVHVPLTIGLLVSLAVHVVVVFYYR